MRKLIPLLAVAAMLLASCGGPADTLSRVKASGKLVIGTSADYAPYEFHTMVDGQDAIVGFDIEIAKEIAKDLGVKLEIQDIGFDGLLQALNADKVDMVISGMTPTEERKQAIDFSDIYYVARQAVLVRAADAATLTSLESLAGKPVGAQTTSIQEGLVKESLALSQLVSLGRIPDLVLELKNSKIDALVVELPVANGYVAANPDLAISSIAIGSEEGAAIAVKKNNQAFVEALNKTLLRLKDSGEIDRFVTQATELNVPAQ